MTPPFHPGQLLMVDIEGTRLDAATEDFLRGHRIRAVCLFRKNLGSEEEVRRLMADLHRVLGERALIGIDQEGGAVTRITWLPQAPAAMALGAAGDLALAGQVGAAVARGLRSLGINWNFAPVLDVNSNPANPVIAERSFGADPQAVARLAGAWLRGALAEGVACCLKHFPGHGDTHEDSHHALPTVDKSLAELHALELLPFAELTRGPGAAPSVMTAHIVYPQLDAGRPATLSPRLIADVLRGTLGYDGVVITDALMMKAVHERWGHARAAVMALAAGADMPLAQGSRAEQAAAVEAIAQALAAGELSLAALQRSCARLDALAWRHPARQCPYPIAQREADAALMQRAWTRGLTALGGAAPPARTRPLRVVAQRHVASDGVSEAGLDAAALRPLFDGFADVQWLEVDDLAGARPGAWPRDGRFTVLAGNHRRRYCHPPLEADLHLALWNPFQVADVAAPALVTWGHADGALAAARAWLRGEVAAQGRAPVPLAAATAPSAQPANA